MEVESLGMRRVNRQAVCLPELEFKEQKPAKKVILKYSWCFSGSCNRDPG